MLHEYDSVASDCRERVVRMTQLHSCGLIRKVLWAEGDPGEAAEDHAARGVRRALLESVLALSCSDAVTDNLAAALGPLPDQAAEAHALARELYGGTRMLLACLPDEALARVASGWRCDLAEVLAPVRAARPVSGGSGYDFDLVMELRTLHFDLP